MFKVAIAGHKETLFFDDKDYVKRRVEDTITVLKREHGEDLTLLLCGSPGVHLWVGDFALEHNIKFKLFLPCAVEEYSKYWKDDQIESLKKQSNSSLCIGTYTGLSSCNMKHINNRNEEMVAECNVMFAFWIGRKLGETFDCIKKAVISGRQVFNAYDENMTQILIDDLV